MSGRVLRISTHSNSQNFSADLRYSSDGNVRLSASTVFVFSLCDQDKEDLRWYFEDYLQFPQDPAPRIAGRIEARICAIGTELFSVLFESNQATRDIWSEISSELAQLRVEVVTSAIDETFIPWELAQDPFSKNPLSLSVNSFVRSTADGNATLPAQTCSTTIRILLVICRPAGGMDIPFRSVASQLIKGVGKHSSVGVNLTVLRPPTFKRLQSVLLESRAREQPFHVVHFDGHGTFVDVDHVRHFAQFASSTIERTARGKHGFVVFENLERDSDGELIHGSAMGQLLAKCGVSVLTLNACRSAHSEATAEPVEGAEPELDSQVTAFSSFSHNVIDAGVTGVVAMLYNVYVVTAAQFVANLYSSLGKGASLGEAVTDGRKQLASNPMRAIAGCSRRLEDWCVPIVYESTPIAIRRDDDAPSSDLNREKTSPADRRIPDPPAVGFFGRDETLLAIDRSFDVDSIVLLHAYAGSGKTATASEFARWYSSTGGVDGPVLFTSFDQYIPFVRVLDSFGVVFEGKLRESGCQWFALNEQEKENVVLAQLQYTPVLWIWDNVESVAGFPMGSVTRWTDDERATLREFLRKSSATKAKFLLTSRRTEDQWLGELPSRVHIPPMPMRERIQLTDALLAQKGATLTADSADWRPLLNLTQGNPLTITAMVGQLTLDRLSTSDEINEFADRLRRGNTRFEGELGEGLFTAWEYSYKNAFDDSERRLVSLLFLFQGFVDAADFHPFCDGESKTNLFSKDGISSDSVLQVLTQCSDLGMLTRTGSRFFTIHPATSTFLKNHFAANYPPTGGASSTQAKQAFVTTMSSLGGYIAEQFGSGDREILHLAAMQEANLLNAFNLALEQSWIGDAANVMHGILHFYSIGGRRAEWKQLVKSISPHVTDPKTDGPVRGRESAWYSVLGFRVFVAKEEHDWDEAIRLLHTIEGVDRARVAEFSDVPDDMLTPQQKRDLYRLQVTLDHLVSAKRRSGIAQTEDEMRESYEVAVRCGNQTAAAACAFNIGNALKEENWKRAMHWFRTSLEMHSESDGLGRGRCLVALGELGLNELQEIFESGGAQQELDFLLNLTMQSLLEADQVLPLSASYDRAVLHRRLGDAFGVHMSDVASAMSHYRKAIHFFEENDNELAAGVARIDAAMLLAGAGLVDDGMAFAESAKEIFIKYGDVATGNLAQADQVMELLLQIRDDPSFLSRRLDGL